MINFWAKNWLIIQILRNKNHFKPTQKNSKIIHQKTAVWSLKNFTSKIDKKPSRFWILNPNNPNSPYIGETAPEGIGKGIFPITGITGILQLGQPLSGFHFFRSCLIFVR